MIPPNQRSKSYQLLDPKILADEKARLEIQGDALFREEKPAIEGFKLGAPRRVLDLGCGNGGYLRQLKALFPSAEIIAADRNPSLLAEIPRVHPTVKTREVDLGSEEALSRLLKDEAPDIIVARYVFQHLSDSEVKMALEVIRKNTNNCKLLVIDPDERFVKFNPIASAMSQMLQCKIDKQKRLGGNRNRGSELSGLMAECGFGLTKDVKITFSLRKMGLHMWKDVFLPILISGLPSEELRSLEVQSLVKEAEAWLAVAESNPNYEIEWPVYIALGETK